MIMIIRGRIFKISNKKKKEENLMDFDGIFFQAISGRRERKNKGYTQLSVRVEPPDDVYADDTPELMT